MGKNNFVDSAIEQGLMSDDTQLDLAIGDAMREIRSLSERIRWFAVFVANRLPKDPAKLLENHFDVLTMWPTLSKEAKKERLLKRIEIILRIHGIRPDDGKLHIPISNIFIISVRYCLRKSWLT